LNGRSCWVSPRYGSRTNLTGCRLKRICLLFLSFLNKTFYSLRIDGTESFDIIPPSYQHLQHDDGNIRYQTSIYGTNSRLSGRPNRLNEYQTQHLSNTDNHNDLLSEHRIYRDRAAAKIQAAYRGYSVRKSLPWLNENHLHSEHNKRVNFKTKR
jgi:hypothetical protein